MIRGFFVYFKSNKDIIIKHSIYALFYTLILSCNIAPLFDVNNCFSDI